MKCAALAACIACPPAGPAQAELAPGRNICTGQTECREFTGRCRDVTQDDLFRETPLEISLGADGTLEGVFKPDRRRNRLDIMRGGEVIAFRDVSRLDLVRIHPETLAFTRSCVRNWPRGDAEAIQPMIYRGQCEVTR
jgi:hypothetical protein